MKRITVANVRHTAKVATVAAKLLFAVRRALPWWLRGIALLTVGVKIVTTPLPFDGGVDEFLMLVTLALLWWRRRALVKACWHEAKAAVPSAR